MSRTSSATTDRRLEHPSHSCPLCGNKSARGQQLPVDSVLLSHVRVLDLENRELRARADEKHLASCTACKTLRKENADLRELIRHHEKTIAELKERANRSSANSSCPPSSDQPDAKRYPKKRRAPGKKRGGQPGHPGSSFKPYTDAEADITPHHHHPDLCEHCGHDVFDAEVQDDAAPHQVVEPPKLKPQVAEHHLHGRRCARCREVTRAKLPLTVTTSNFGPQTSAIVCLLSGCYALSRRQVGNLMGDLFGIRMSLGVIPTIEKRMTDALAQPVSAVKESVKQADRVHNDATGWKQNGKRRYAFVSVTPDVVSFDITKKHNADVVNEILGPNFKGILVSDRHGIYGGIPLEQRQICNSHTDRDFRKIEERGAASQPVGEQGADLEHQLFHQWHRLERGEITRTQLRNECESIEGSMKNVLTQGMICCPHSDKSDNVNVLIICIWCGRSDWM
jgi:transposase